MCTSLAPFLCRPPRATIARGPEQDSLPSDHYEPTSSLVTLWVSKRLLSCRPLRVRSHLVGSTVRHLGTPCVKWSACASLPFTGVHKGFIGGILFIRKSGRTLSELQVLPTRRAVYKLEIPVMFTRVASEEFLSLTVLSDSAPSSEFLHPLAHDAVFFIMYEVPPHREIWRNYPQDSRTCDERSPEPTPKKPGTVPHGIRLPGISPSRSFHAAGKTLTVNCGPSWSMMFRIVHEDGRVLW